MGPDRAMVMGQGTLSDWRREHLSQTDVAVVKFRKMLQRAWKEERRQMAANGPDTGQAKSRRLLTVA